ncbi:hypothetical protein M758_11G078900 [Ceratodon purpureus]|uniref:Uncharacterized protein n=1 Tax=Ceratodon purpureus TaxID=3225 RepID=A0A8T0GC96_CERPU|nr:hypothetical protein KC19_11G081500 [Ceratodon purpureus]KAG0601032.1 hypothetical protein M758_11G078900 [Ceratodon purpureus]
MIEILNLRDVVVVKLQLREALQSNQVINIPNPCIGEIKPVNFLHGQHLFALLDSFIRCAFNLNGRPEKLGGDSLPFPHREAPNLHNTLCRTPPQ